MPAKRRGSAHFGAVNRWLRVTSCLKTAGNLANVGFNGFKGWLSVSVFFPMGAGGSDLTTELVGGEPAIRENLFLSVNYLTPVYRLLNY